MRLRTFLRQTRRDLGLSLGDVSAVTGVSRGDLSRLERGYLLPTEAQLERLVQVYGHVSSWYPAGVFHSIDPVDLTDRICPGCGEPLEPESSRRRVYHDDACRARARRIHHGAMVVQARSGSSRPIGVTSTSA